MKSTAQNLLPVLAILFTLSLSGCGGNEPKVIEHTEDYQLSEQEQANKQAEIEARKQGN